MKTCPSAFYKTSIYLSFKDIFKLFIGKEIKEGGFVIGTWSMPDNGCTCPQCTERFKKKRKQGD